VRVSAIGRVDRQRLPVVVIRHQHALGSQHSGQLANHRGGVGYVLQDAVDPAGVEAGVVERQVGGVGNIER
jgi:hypothetical protein